MTALILSTFTSRFIFPLLSLEGRNFWVLGLLPLKREAILWGKFAFASGISLVATEVLVVLSDLMLRMGPAMIALHMGMVAVLCFGLSGISVGLGARLPNLKESDPSKIAAGFGGTLNLLVSLVFIFSIVTGPGPALPPLLRRGRGRRRSARSPSPRSGSGSGSPWRSSSAWSSASSGRSSRSGSGSRRSRRWSSERFRAFAPSAVASRGDERRVLGRGAAEFEGGEQAVEVAGEQRIGVEPEAGEDLGPEDAVGARRHRLESVAAPDEPVDVFRVEGHDQVFEDAGAPVVFELRARGRSPCSNGRPR